jgi:hypothetical protein
VNIFDAAAALARVKQRLGRSSFSTTYSTNGEGGIVVLRGTLGSIVEY